MKKCRPTDGSELHRVRALASCLPQSAAHRSQVMFPWPAPQSSKSDYEIGYRI